METIEYDQNDLILIQYIYNSKNICLLAEILQIRRKTLFNQSIFYSAYRILKYKIYKRQISVKSKRGKYVYVNPYVMANIKI